MRSPWRTAKRHAWECSPELYGFTAASREVGFASEADSTTGLLIGWPSHGCTVPELTELIRTGVGRVQVTVLVDAQHQQGAKSCLEHRRMTAAQVAQVECVDVAVDSVWIRDYGPEFVAGATRARCTA